MGDSPITTVWTDPVPLFTSTSVGAAFPVQALPPPLAKMVTEVASATQTDPAMAGTMMLGVLAICLQRKYVVELPNGHAQQLSLYVLICAGSSERKSSVLKIVREPVSVFEKNLRTQAQNQHRVQLRTQSRLSRRLSQAKTAAVIDEQKVSALENELAQLPQVTIPQLIIDDATPEAMVVAMAQNSGRIGMVSAEGNAFNGFLSKNPNSANGFAVWLKSFSGDDIVVNRLSREKINIPSPALSLIVGLKSSKK